MSWEPGPPWCLPPSGFHISQGSHNRVKTLAHKESWYTHLRPALEKGQRQKISVGVHG